MSLIRAMESQKISLHIHSFVYECKQKCWQLTRSGREVSFMWVPAYVRNVENERVDFEARQATLSNMVYNAQSVARDLLPVAKQRMLDEWQKSWDVAETGGFLHSIFPRVSLRPWFEEWRTERKLITTVSRIILGHCGVRAHLKRFSIVDGSMCVCLEDHETVDHIIWKCSCFLSQRGDPIRDLCAQLNWKALKKCFMFFGECGVKM
jgi:hypothetical protein